MIKSNHEQFNEMEDLSQFQKAKEYSLKNKGYDAVKFQGNSQQIEIDYPYTDQLKAEQITN